MATLDEIRRARLKKLETVKKAGLNPYPETAKRTHTLKEANEQFDSLLAGEKEITVAGRIMDLRSDGGLVFADLNDGTGRLRAIFAKSKIGPKGFDFFNEIFDAGDFIEVRGILSESKETGKIIEAIDYKMLSKSLKPLPKEWLDADMKKNPQGKAIPGTGIEEEDSLYSAIAKESADFLKDKGFSDTFVDGSFLGGFGKVFEIGKEDPEGSHGPDLGCLELYWSYADYRAVMKLAEEMVVSAIAKTIGEEKNTFSQPWNRIEYSDLLERYTGIKYSDESEKGLVQKGKELGVNIPEGASKAVLADEICGKYCWPELADPTFVLHSPKGSRNFVKQSEKHPEKLADSRLIVGGVEIANIFLELNDPLEFSGKIDNPSSGIIERQWELSREMMEYGIPPAGRISMDLGKLVLLLSDRGKPKEAQKSSLMKLREIGSLPSSASGRKINKPKGLKKK